MPRQTDTYIHRSGRTARAAQVGISVLFVGPEDVATYRKVIQTLARGEDLPLFPVEVAYFASK